MRLPLCVVIYLWFTLVQTTAQELPLQELEEVIVSDIRVKRYAEGHKVVELKDSILYRNGIWLTSLLAQNSNIYFKENGLGMVSSPSFRGTNASHTAVVWNGININSQLTGQVDFNTVNPYTYSSVAIRSGGGSVQFGTGAIGGSIHLNNDLTFDKHFKNHVVTGYGSFDTASLNYGGSVATGRWSSNFGVTYNRSDNDYRYLETGERNTNGAFDHVNINFNTGYLLNGTQALRLYHQSFMGDRNLSGTLVAPGRSRYKDTHHRTQLEWGRFGKKATAKLKLAHLYEGYNYFENKDSDIFTERAVTTLLVRYSQDLTLSKAFRLLSFVQYNHLRGSGNNFGTPTRNDVALTSMLKHTVSEAFRYNLSLRQDISSDFSAPLVFAWNGSYDFGETYQLQLNASRNFGMPTFNDLYWQPGGNLELRPENSYQFDVGQRFAFKSFSLQLNGYHIVTEDMIRWLPNTNGIWSPINVDKVRIYGVEATLDFKKEIAKKQELELHANYGYTVSEDTATDQQLSYVPFHRGNASITYRFGRIGFFYQHLYNGPVSITRGELEGYQVANMGLTYASKIGGTLKWRLGVTVNKVFNAYYENVALRPMPNRNIQSQLILNF